MSALASSDEHRRPQLVLVMRASRTPRDGLLSALSTKRRPAVRADPQIRGRIDPGPCERSDEAPREDIKRSPDLAATTQTDI